VALISGLASAAARQIAGPSLGATPSALENPIPSPADAISMIASVSGHFQNGSGLQAIGSKESDKRAFPAGG